MSTEITVQIFDDRQIEIMRRTVAQGISNDEFLFFLEVCKGRGLNPFNREIYALSGKGGKVTFQVSIDGLRLIAERSGKYKGQLGPYFCGKDGQWREEWLESTPPVAAKVGVLRDGFDKPIWAVARYAAYVGTGPVWQKAPELMVSKCAESLALRRAFPAEMGGLYTHEEMGQAAETSAPSAAVVDAKPAKAKPASNGLTLGKLKHRAIETGWISGESSEQLLAAWNARVSDVFGGMMEDEELASPESLALVNFAIEKHAAEAQGVEVGVPGKK